MSRKPLVKNERAIKIVQARMTPSQKKRLRALSAFYEEPDSAVIRRLILVEYKRLVKSGDVKNDWEL